MRYHASSYGTRRAFVAAVVVLGFVGFLFTGSPPFANAIELQKLQKAPATKLPPGYGVALYVSSVSSSTSGAILGGQIQVTDTTTNLGTLASGTPSYTRYYL